MKVLITGAHFTPAEAVIKKLQEFEKDVQIVYVGRKHTQEGDQTLSLESKLTANLGVKFIPVTTGRLQRRFTSHTIPSLFKIPWGLLQAFWIILTEQPQVILSFGGYVAVPTVIVSWLFSIPILIHEQTLVTGLANTISGYFADKIAVSFDINYGFPADKLIYTGNPMRPAIFARLKKGSTVLANFLKQSKDKPIIFITGGNQGSHQINLTIEKLIPTLLSKYFIVHQTGDSRFQDFVRLQQLKDSLGTLKDHYLLQKTFNGEDMAFLMHNSDLVISRAGINTLLELGYFGTPTIVIPLPYLYKNEQTVNAKFFESLGLMKVLNQADLNPQNLQRVIEETITILPQMKKAAVKTRALVVKDAASRLALEVLLLAR